MKFYPMLIQNGLWQNSAVVELSLKTLAEHCKSTLSFRIQLNPGPGAFVSPETDPSAD